jgi:hypothetical protein
MERSRKPVILTDLLALFTQLGTIEQKQNVAA